MPSVLNISWLVFNKCFRLTYTYFATYQIRNLEFGHAGVWDTPPPRSDTVKEGLFELLEFCGYRDNMFEVELAKTKGETNAIADFFEWTNIRHKISTKKIRLIFLIQRSQFRMDI